MPDSEHVVIMPDVSGYTETGAPMVSSSKLEPPQPKKPAEPAEAAEQQENA